MDHPLPEIWNDQRRLARLKPDDWRQIGLASLLIAFGFSLFHFMGNTADAGRWGRSALVWMVQRWNDSGIAMGQGDYSHGFLVPVASLYVVWMNRFELLKAPKRVCGLGLVFIAGALLLHYLGVKTQQTRVSLVAMIGLLWSVPFYFYGWQVGKRLLFPCAFMIFAVPLNFLDNLTFPLRMVNTRAAVATLQGLGVEVRQVGTAIFGPPFDATAELKLDVADPCSGIRSLTAMMALTAIYGYMVMKSPLRKWILFLCAIPLAMVGNMFRITAIGIIAEAFGTDVAAGVIHDYSGFLVFGMAIALMVGLSFFLNLDFKEALFRWKKKLGSASI
ncbi:MAG: exosortase/archaeosortase family protein [Verrucomicrobia bacterium]|nr:exosortase/archaeosortase family protein [Verrucomicrobiota bacterium]MCH8511104.1 exosortase/archaeosortase family protein [Kiritimatiellia bacterium]